MKYQGLMGMLYQTFVDLKYNLFVYSKLSQSRLAYLTTLRMFQKADLHTKVQLGCWLSILNEKCNLGRQFRFCPLMNLIYIRSQEIKILDKVQVH